MGNPLNLGVKGLVTGCLFFGMAGSSWALSALENPGEPSLSASEDLLEVEPVDSPPSDSTEATSEPSPLERLGTDEFGQERLLYPFYFSAYVPRPGRTEVNLGLFLSQSPGIDVAVSWSALEDIMFSAKMSALGASNTVGLGMRWMVLPETPTSSKPAISLLLNALFLNHRTLGEPRENIYRGSRIQAGAAISKDLGSLALALNASEGLQSFLSYFRIHAEVLAEFQTGREGVEERSTGELNAGAKAALEAIVEPGQLYFFLAMDTIPDWVDHQNYYLGVRYYSQPDLAFDVFGGQLQNGYGVVAGLSWIF